MIDMVVPRSQLREKLALLVSYWRRRRRKRPDGRLRRSTDPASGPARQAIQAVARRGSARFRAHCAIFSIASAGRRMPAARPPRRRDQRQGLDRAPSSAPRSKQRVQGPRLHQPASGPLQRAHPHRRKPDRRPAAGASSSPRYWTSARASNPASSRSQRPWQYSPSPARQRTRAFWRSALAVGSTRPTSSRTAGYRDRQPRARSPAIPRPRTHRHRRRESRHRQARCPADHPALPARRGDARREIAREEHAPWLPRGGVWDAIARTASSAIATSRAPSNCLCPACPAAIRR